MKKPSIIVLATTVAITPAYAEIHDTPIASPVANHSETADLAFAFEDVDNLQLTAMTNQEMQETEGAWAANAIGAGIGGLTGHFGYMATSVASGKYNFAHHMGAIGVGAGTGAINPAFAVGRAVAMSNGARFVGTFGVTTGGGIAADRASGRFRTINY